MIDPHAKLQLRLECLKLSQSSHILSTDGYDVVTRAQRYYEFVCGQDEPHKLFRKPVSKSRIVSQPFGDD
jgi:hypothetical protein